MIECESVVVSRHSAGDLSTETTVAQRCRETDDADLEPLVSAAVLTVTAFRLSDHEALMSALRLLAQTTADFEAGQRA